jgi:methyl-accepting chemotaxis protein
LAEFATLLRTEKNPATLYNQLITGIAKQVSALQAALYIINDDTSDEKYIELVASYAAPLEKHQKKQITLEDGLLGQVYTTQKEIYLEQVPTHYFPIQSGLGDALPTTLLILPMAFNEEVFGLIELAAFSPFETYQLEFLRKISEAIATTVAGLKINAHNEALLSDRQAKNDLIQQQATEIAQKEEFYLGIIRQLEHTIQESAPQKIISG